MNKEVELAKIIVRLGERMTGSVQEWTAGSTDDERLCGRIESTLAFLKALESDIASAMSMTDLYKLSSQEPPDPGSELESEEDSLRRLLQLKTDECEMFQVKYLEAVSNAHQEN